MDREFNDIQAKNEHVGSNSMPRFSYTERNPMNTASAYTEHNIDSHPAPKTASASEAAKPPKVAKKKQKKLSVKILSYVVAIAGAAMVTTAAAQVFATLNDDQVSVEVYRTNDDAVGFYVDVHDYTPENELTFTVTQRSVPLYSQAFLTQDNALYISGEVRNLQLGEYEFAIYDGSRQVWHKLYAKEPTPEPILLTQDQVQATILSATQGDALSFTIRVHDYAPVSALRLAISLADEVVHSLAFEQDSYAYIASGELASYVSGQYLFAIYDGDDCVWEQTFTHVVTPPPTGLNDEQVQLSVECATTGLTFRAVVTGYTPWDEMRLEVSNAAENYFVQAFDKGEQWECEGSLTALAPDTAYTFAIVQGDNILWSAVYSTTALPSPDVSLHAQGKAVSYSLTIAGYAPLGQLAVCLAVEGEEKYRAPIQLDADGGAYDTIADLAYDTTYTFTLFEDQMTLWTGTVTTDKDPETAYRLTDVIPEFSFESNVLFYAVTLPAYEVYQGVRFVLVEAQYEGEMAADEDGNVVGEGVVEGLAYDTTYTVRIEDGDRLLWTGTVTTEDEPQVISNVTLTPDESELAFSFTLHGNYVEQSDLTVIVAIPDSADSYEGEYSRNQDNDGNWACEGHVTDLNPETEYAFYIYDGETLLYQEGFTTPEHFEPVATIQLSPTDHSLGFRFVFDENYTVQDFISVQAYDGDTNETTQVTPVERVCSGTLSNLASNSTYSLYIYDGNEVIYYDEFTTEMDLETDYLLAEVDCELEVEDNTISYRVSLPDYTVMDGIYIMLADTELRYDLSEDTGVVSGEGTFEGLDYDTTYTVRIMDGNRLLWTDTQTTADQGLWLDALLVQLTVSSTDVQFAVDAPYGGVYGLVAQLLVDDVVDRSTNLSTLSSCEGRFVDLEANTVYKFRIMDGEYLLHEESIKTADGVLEMSQDGALTVSAGVLNCEPESGTFVLKVQNLDNDYSENFTLETQTDPTGEYDSVYGIQQELTDLEPGQYIAEIWDGGILMQRCVCDVTQ